MVTTFVKGKINETARMIVPTINTEMEGVLNFGWSRLRGEGRSLSLDIEKAIRETPKIDVSKTLAMANIPPRETMDFRTGDPTGPIASARGELESLKT
jgi:hypothetical protein